MHKRYTCTLILQAYNYVQVFVLTEGVLKTYLLIMDASLSCLYAMTGASDHLKVNIEIINKPYI